MDTIIKKSKKDFLSIHLLGWLVFGVFYFMPVLNLIFDDSNPNPQRHHRRGFHLWEVAPDLFLYHSIFHFVFLAIIFYLVYFLLLPQFLNTRKFLPLMIGLLLSVVFVFILDGIAIKYISSMVNTELKDFRRFQSLSYIISVVLSIMVSISTKMILEWLESEKQKTILQNQKLSTELALLKSQINPHFLFNSLNNIRSLVRKKSENAESAILKISDMMRYVLHEANKDKVLLDKELNYLSDFLELQKLRMADNIIININIPSTNHDVEIAPMLLLPLVENAFKHGISYQKPSFVNIRINIENEELTLEVENSIHATNDLENESSGLGLKNLKRRLEILYPNKHRLQLQNNTTVFLGKLQIYLGHDKRTID